MSENPVVTIPQGKLRGKVGVDYSGRNFNSFQGIPYAKPPIGALRFKPTQPPEKWSGIRDATQEGQECYSRSMTTGRFGGSEDCLFLNVYTPQKSDGKLYPVMFWIHGGGFARGSGGTELFGPEYLLTQDIVLVTINYRLGALGFLSFPNPSVGVTGNAGLKDIVMALKWVKNNIKYFSGDPKNVTIFGESAGSASCHLLILSPMAKGLFHKAILQSGCALNSFTKSRSSYIYELAQNLGIDSNDDQHILNELQKLSVEELFQGVNKIFDPFLVSNTRPFCPVIEPKFKDSFLSEDPLSIMESGKYNHVPMIMGYNSQEGVLVYTLMKTFKKNYFIHDGTLVPIGMNLRIGSDSYKKALNEIKSFYGIQGNESDENHDDLQKALKVFTHNYIVYDVCKSAFLHAQNNKYPIYLYRFDLDTELNFIKWLSRVNVKGAVHADDIAYLFSNIFISPPEAGTVEEQSIRKMTALWTNFAKFGDPTPKRNDVIQTKWIPANKEQKHFLAIENDNIQMVLSPDKKYIDFWEHLYNKYQIRLSKL